MGIFEQLQELATGTDLEFLWNTFTVGREVLCLTEEQHGVLALPRLIAASHAGFVAESLIKESGRMAAQAELEIACLRGEKAKMVFRFQESISYISLRCQRFTIRLSSVPFPMSYITVYTYFNKIRSFKLQYMPQY